MSEQLLTSVTTVLMAIVGVAIIAILVSKQAQTGAVLKSGGDAFSGILGAAISPLRTSGFTGPGVTIPGYNG